MSGSFSPPPDLWELLIALFISVISGTLSIARRVIAGHPASILWILTEFLTAILCGYLMYNTYPLISGSLPEWLTLPVAVAVAAHSGGRIFQELEHTLVKHYKFFSRPPN